MRSCRCYRGHASCKLCPPLYQSQRQHLSIGEGNGLLANPAVFTPVVTELACCLETARFVCYPSTVSNIILRVISANIQPILEDEDVDSQCISVLSDFFEVWREMTLYSLLVSHDPHFRTLRTPPVST